ncbi:hypothetical protein LTS18_004187 [Coniosporium uncinatum]|uniref:Uncharacterized protein n=1 Tax=Coniosporium uncinatum TaxID=93489 RepID=A0ACC3D6C6_9PEZI|nr:hypothetical protein LTS18_004187 [Coniosporium uncinatum]
MSQDPGSEIENSGANFTKKIHNDTYPFIEPTKADASGKYVFITGASKGIGRATALSYAKAGISGLALGARSSLESLEKEIKEAANTNGKQEPEILRLKLDVADRQSVEDAAKQIEQAWGRIDIVVNNAGVLENFVPLHESDPDEWWRSWEVMVKGPYLVMRSCIPLLLKGEHKIIVNVSSIGQNILMNGASAYQSAKLALHRVTEFVNFEYADQKILAFVIHPGGVPTELAQNMPKDFHGLLVDQPELAADALVWMTKQRRDWLAARYVSCTWDMEELEARKDEIMKSDLLKVRMAVKA